MASTTDTLAYRTSMLATHLSGYMCREDDFLYIYIPRKHGDFYAWLWGDQWQGSIDQPDFDAAITFTERHQIAQWIEDMRNE